MFVADAGVALWIAGLLLVGFLGFFLVLVTMVFRFLGWVWRALAGTESDRRKIAAPRDPDGRRRICPDPRCGHSNRPAALYCGRCGRPLRQPYDVDAHG